MTSALSRRRVRRLTIGLTAAACAASVAAVVPAADAATPHVVPSATPAWTAHAAHLGKAKDSAPVTARIYLAPRGGVTAVRDAAVEMATPGSAAYHKFLTPAQYRARFEPSRSTVSAVRAWLTGAGLKVTEVEPSRRFIAVRGNAKQAERAFGTSIQRFRHDTQTVQAPSGAVTVPGNVASSVLTITGLDTTAAKVTPASSATRSKAIKPPAGFRNARPCSLYYGQIPAKTEADYKTPLPTFHGQRLPYAPCGYTGPQFRAAYEGTSTLTGAGTSVAILDAYASSYIAQDAETYAENHGDGSYAPGQLSQVITKPFKHAGPTGCDAPGWSSEESLDVEAVHAMAPSAHIVYYGSASCYDTDFIDALGKIVDQDAVQLVSNSWDGLSQDANSDLVASYEQVFLQGATEGISFLFSSGDDGDELASTGLKQTDFPVSDPYVTAVGGTSTAINAEGSIASQTGWGTQKYLLSNGSWAPVGFLYGSGGGYSSLFNRPSYQDGTVSSPYRGVPDVAMDADPNTGMMIGETQTFSDGTHYDEYRIGGTSLASPLFAGMTALKIESDHGKGYGLLDPTIYRATNRADFTDVKPTPDHVGDVRVDFANGEDASNGLLYSVRTFDQDSSLATTKGWDPVTGVGTPNQSWLSK